MIAEYTLFFIITTLITSVLLNLYDEKQILKNTYVECSKVSVKDCEFGLGVFANKNLKKNKHPAEHQGHIFYPSKSFATLQNLVRLSL